MEICPHFLSPSTLDSDESSQPRLSSMRFTLSGCPERAAYLVNLSEPHVGVPKRERRSSDADDAALLAVTNLSTRGVGGSSDCKSDCKNKDWEEADRGQGGT